MTLAAALTRHRIPRVLLAGLSLAALAFPGAAGFGDPVLGRLSMKLSSLAGGQVTPGSAILLRPDEIDALVQTRVADRLHGIRSAKVVLGTGSATASALIDFTKIMAEEGQPLNPVAARLFQGERPVRVVARIASAGGKATVTPTRVEVSGVAATGPALDFLVKTFLLPLFPEVKIGEPFDLGFGIDHLDVRPDGVHIAIKGG